MLSKVPTKINYYSNRYFKHTIISLDNTISKSISYNRFTGKLNQKVLIKQIKQPSIDCSFSLWYAVSELMDTLILSGFWQWQPMSLWKLSLSCQKHFHLMLQIMAKRNRVYKVLMLPYFSWQAIGRTRRPTVWPHSYRYRRHCIQVCHIFVEPSKKVEKLNKLVYAHKYKTVNNIK